MLYVGPEVLMPLVSVLAAIGGAILMFWRKLMKGARAAARFTARLVRRTP